MNERRHSTRNNLEMKAKFFGSNGWEDCIITDASRDGLGVNFFTREKIKEGSLIHFRILLPSEPNPVEVNASLKWIEKQDGYYVGGVEWFQIDRGFK